MPIFAFESYKLLVSPHLCYFSIFNVYYVVSILYCTQSMCSYNHCFTSTQIIDFVNNRFFCIGIQRGGRFIK